AGTDGTNPPGTANQSANTAEDMPMTVTLHAARPNNNDLTFSIVGGGPAHGSLGGISASSCSGGDCTATVTYTPGPDYNGPDSFKFKVNNGNADSNTSTVSISVSEVNDSPVAANDAKSMNQDTTLNFPASFLNALSEKAPGRYRSRYCTNVARPDLVRFFVVDSLRSRSCRSERRHETMKTRRFMYRRLSRGAEVLI